MSENAIATILVDIFYRIHKTLGPGLYEEVYEECICYELAALNVQFKRQLPLPLVYQNVRLEKGYKLDILVENKVIVEVKSVEVISELHHKQLITYLGLSDRRLGLLVNFNVPYIREGIFRKVNKLTDA